MNKKPSPKARQAAEIERDAARYRFLRSKDSRCDPFVELRRAMRVGVVDWAKNLSPRTKSNMWSRKDLTGAALDREIDKQMRKAK
jgi:hypothetical protein